MLCWGIDIINYIKYQRTIKLSELFSLFTLVHVAYIALMLIICRWLFWKFYISKKYFLLSAGIILTGVAFIFFRYCIEEIIFPATIGERNYNPNTTIVYYILDNIYYAGLYLLMGVFVFMIDYQVSSRKKEALLVQQQKEAELSFLRSQISPHFLFNSLNNIYSLSYRNHPQTPSAILTLSELMRFMLYENQSLIPVQKEWGYIHHYISLQKLRFDAPVFIQATEENLSGEFQITPYLLIPFVENAFKHGDVTDPQLPLQIRLVMDHQFLHFYVCNKISNSQKDKDGGIGLHNVKRRLQLLYEGKHELNITQTNAQFNIHLQIQLT